MSEPAGKLDARERKLLGILLAVLGGTIVLLVPVLLWQSLEARRSKNQELRDLITTVQEARGVIAERKTKHDQVVARYAKAAPPLGGFIEEAARANGLTVPETQDRPETPHGKRFSERTTVVKMHRVGMKALAKTLEKIEQSGHPIVISKFNLKPRAGEPDSYEVELGVSAFDRKGDGKAEAPKEVPAADDDEEDPQ